jgi:hypothetical protein
MRKSFRLIFCAVFLFNLSGTASAAVTWYTNEADWLAAAGSISAFDFTAANTALANEVSSAPVGQTNLGTGKLTFESDITGVSTDFSFTNEGTSSNSVYWVFDALFTGPSADHDFSIDLDFATSPKAIAITYVIDVNGMATDSVSVVDSNGLLLDNWTTGAALPGGRFFLGAVSDEDLGGLVWNDSSASGGPRIESVMFNAAIPIPAAVWLFGSALAGLGWMRRKQPA